MQNPEMTPPIEPKVARKSSRPSPILIFLGILAAVILIAGLAGFLTGRQIKETRQETTNHTLAAEQFTLAVEDMQAGNFRGAIDRLQYIPSLEPGYPGLAEKLQEALVGLNATPTPMPTSTPVPSPTPDIAHADQLWLQVQEQFKNADWGGMLISLLTLKVDVPDYQPLRVDGMVFVSLRNLGLDRIGKAEFAEGLYYLDLAKNYGPLDQKALEREIFAETFLENYQAAYYYRTKDLEKSMQYFALVYSMAPNYRPNLARDYSETISEDAQKMMDQGRYCQARDEFNQALDIQPDNAQLLALRNQAEKSCAPPATATPEITDTLTP
jgi:tetratricopeptide (TPR) repeat protein